MTQIDYYLQMKPGARDKFNSVKINLAVMNIVQMPTLKLLNKIIKDDGSTNNKNQCD